MYFIWVVWEKSAKEFYASVSQIYIANQVSENSLNLDKAGKPVCGLEQSQST